MKVFGFSLEIGRVGNSDLYFCPDSGFSFPSSLGFSKFSDATLTFTLLSHNEGKGKLKRNCRESNEIGSNVSPLSSGSHVLRSGRKVL